MTDEEIKARAMATLMGVDIEVDGSHIYVKRSNLGYYWPRSTWAKVIELLRSDMLVKNRQAAIEQLAKLGI